MKDLWRYQKRNGGGEIQKNQNISVILLLKIAYICVLVRRGDAMGIKLILRRGMCILYIFGKED